MFVTKDWLMSTVCTIHTVGIIHTVDTIQNIQ